MSFSYHKSGTKSALRKDIAAQMTASSGIDISSGEALLGLLRPDASESEGFELSANGHEGKIYSLSLKPIGSIVAMLLLLSSFILHPSAFCRAQTPNLVVTAGTNSQAPSLTITSDSAMPWKVFTATGSASNGSGSYNVIWAESNGTVGGIYFGSISTSSTGPAALPAPQPADSLPIAALTTNAAAAVAGVDSATVAAASAGYETLAKEIDAGAITNPTQLYLSLGVQSLALAGSERTSVEPLTAAVKSWLNTQQTAGKLDETKMADYAQSFHAIAAALKPRVKISGVPPIGPATSAKTPSPAGPTPRLLVRMAIVR